MNTTTNNHSTNELRLFKFRKIDKCLIESIVNPSLYFAKFNVLNDPFDCKLDLLKSWERAAASATGQRKAWFNSFSFSDFSIQFKRQLEEAGICSFSMRLDKPLDTSVMWSHYADEHKGCCLMYKFPESFISGNSIGIGEVIYEDNALTQWLLNDATTDLNDFVAGLFQHYLSVKSPAWKVSAKQE
jgi:hypothetical protein